MRRISRISLLATLLMASHSYANPNLAWDPGFGADLSLLTGYTSSRSQFNTDNESTDTLNQQGDRQDNILIAPLGTVNYTFASGKQQLYFGTSRSDLALGRFHIELGYKQRFKDRSQITLSYIPGIMEQDTWQDPYITGQNRQETGSDIKGARFQYDSIMGTPFSIELATGKFSLENERSGSAILPAEQQSVLRRDSDIYYGEVNYLHPLSRAQMLRYALSYTQMDADGDAMANDGLGAEVSWIQRFNQSSFALTLSYDRVVYDALNPVFSETQKDDRWGIFLAYEYSAPFGWEDWGIISLAGYNQSNSNIAFYDEENLLLTVGINYRF
ncbi:hypothetical protein ABT56_06055 [Photobacterium aquae]|uniref:DUF2860 domain-containing protein n=1 Tax=Photobacterium aquae TaxID=1195763 RepID=A0A0J1JXV0_9GAMM|nr:DUF2860 domain-containing protein [Photobacterium aquae]KLV07117.1 hypothetical protein ABT56_06055 [Photobacterium aquae]